MVAYSFQKRFIKPIQAGSKSQTIRGIGKRKHATKGDTLQLYFGMRTKHCRKIIDDVRCVLSTDIQLTFERFEFVDVTKFDTCSLDEFAVADGFTDATEMAEFWRVMHAELFDSDGNGVFSGMLIMWRPPRNGRRHAGRCGAGGKGSDWEGGLMKTHPAANVLPHMPDDEFEALVDDIRENGLLVPIETIDGKIIDGRHRWKACQQLGLEPDIVDVDIGDQSPSEYVWSLNGLRRHLTASQRAAVAVELLPELKKEAKQRQRGGQGGKLLPSILTEATESKGDARDKAAAIVGVAPSYVSDAETIKSESPELFEEVKDGSTTIPKAKEKLRCHVTNNSGNNEWYTPSEFVDAARAVMGGIDLDPCSSEVAQEYIKADNYFTIDDDGLAYEWEGSVWMNPPYGADLIGKFASAIIEYALNGKVSQACVLVNNATETAWGQSLLSACSAACFVRGRIKFLDATGEPAKTPLQGQMILYLGDQTQRFVDEFQDFGVCLEAAK